MKYCLYPVVLILVLVGPSSAEKIVYGGVSIYNFTLTGNHNPRQYLSQFANHTGVQFVYSVWPSMTIEMLRELPHLKLFHCDQGEMQTFHVSPQLLVLKLDVCQTTNLVIDPASSYELAQLNIAHGQLKQMPPNLKALSNLQELMLPNNSIEYLNMDDLRGLNQLAVLVLVDNKISRISSSLKSPVYLPNLQLLYLRNNQLTEVCFSNWDTPLLNGIDLHGNQLIMIQSLERLPALSSIKMRDNPFDCGWLHKTLGELTARNVMFYGPENVSCDLQG